MSFDLELKSLNDEVRKYIPDHFTLKIKNNMFAGSSSQASTEIKCYRVDESRTYVTVPMGHWYHFCDRFINEDYTSELPRVNLKSHKTPYTLQSDPKKYRDQNVVISQALEILKTKRTVFLDLPTGFGKTSVGGILTAALGYKTLVLTQFEIVNEQWKSEFETFTTAKVQYIKGNAAFDKEADVYVCGIQKAANIPEECFYDIGTVIVDEAHVSTLTAFTKVLLRIKPQYLIGLSATPRRKDGLHTLFEMFFDNNVISRFEKKEFVVYKVTTHYKPEIKYINIFGQQRIDWTTVISSIASNTERQARIVDLVINTLSDTDRTMILSDRVEQSENVYNLLLEKGIKAALLTGKVKKWDKECQVLVASTKKAGVGFDDPKLKKIFIISDTTTVEQYEGRARCENSEIYDIVDDYSTLEKHWLLREKWYTKKGATIKTLEL